MPILSSYLEKCSNFVFVIMSYYLSGLVVQFLFTISVGESETRGVVILFGALYPN